MKQTKKWLAGLLTLVLLLTLLPATALAASLGTTIDMADNNPPASGTGWTYAGRVYTILNGANVTITGTNAAWRRIEVAANAKATITLDGVSITGLGDNQSPFLLKAGADVTLTWLANTTNTLTAGSGVGAGIQTTGASLTINGPDTGILNATGGTGLSGGGAGIGGAGGDGTNDGGDGGSITINSGSINAKGGNSRAGAGAGIGGGGAGGGGGGGAGGTGGNITINGGSVTADGGDGTFAGSGAAGIGGGGRSGAGGTISISGGTVEANGGDGANCAGGGAGIGGGGGSGANGDGGTSGDIFVTGNAQVEANGGDGGTTASQATAGSGGAGIGSGGAGQDGGAGAVSTIVNSTTGTVTATGGSGGTSDGTDADGNDGAGIGAGGTGAGTGAVAVFHTVTVTAGANGSVSPSGSVQVNDGGTITFIITASSGYVVSDVVADGASQGAMGSYTFASVNAGHTLEAEFVVQQTTNPDPASDTDPGPTYTQHTLADNATGVTVSGQMTSGARLNVRERVLHAEGTCPACDEIRARMAAGELIILYDISISGGYTGELEVSIPVGEQYNGQTVTILHCKNGVLESVTCVVQNGVARGTFKKLSPFAVVWGVNVGVPENTVVDPPKTGDAPTGGIAGVGLVLLALGLAVMAKKNGIRHPER